MRITTKDDKEPYYALLCYCAGNGKKPQPIICGVYASKKEAQEVAKEVKGCGAKHKIIACKEVSVNSR